MDILYSAPFSILELPNLRIRKPSWLTTPSPMVVFSVILFSYYLVTGGIVYDVIIEPPSIGSTTDQYGHSKPVAFMAYRVNGQYIMEGLASSFMFVLGAIGFIILDQTHSPTTPKFNRVLLIFIGFACCIISFMACYTFMKIKLPSYLLA